MPSTLNAPQILDREFLEVRARLLSIAATLDRLDQAEGSVASDSRRHEIVQAFGVLLEPTPHRAERIQLLFSRPYDEAWKGKMGIQRRNSSTSSPLPSRERGRG